MVKNLPANAGDSGDIGSVPGSLGWEYLLGQEMATYFSILTWEILPWKEEPGGGQKELNTTECTHTRTHSHTTYLTGFHVRGHSKHLLPTTQEKTLHMDITRWSILKLD